SAGLPGKNADQSIRLLGVRPLVEVKRRLPVALLHVSRRVTRQNGVESVERQAFRMSALDVPGDEQLTVSFARRIEPHAWTGRFTVARLEVTAFEMPGIGYAHDRTPSDRVMGFALSTGFSEKLAT